MNFWYIYAILIIFYFNWTALNEFEQRLVAVEQALENCPMPINITGILY